MSKRIYMHVPPGQTRDCLDPWGYVQVQASGLILPCCSHPPVGWITPDRSLDEAFNEITVRTLRNNLLTGDLNEYCLQCSTKKSTSVFNLRRNFANWMLKYNGVSPDKAGSVVLDDNNEIPGFIRFENVLPDQFGFSDAISLRARPSDQPQPHVVFENLVWESNYILDTVVAVPETSPALTCSVFLGARIDDLSLIAVTEIGPGETGQILADLPLTYLKGVAVLAVRLSDPNDNASSSSTVWTFPILRCRPETPSTSYRVDLSAEAANDHLFVEGFSFQELTGRWTVGKSALLNIPPSDSVANPRSLLINAYAFGSSDDPIRYVTITVNDKFLSRVAYQHGVDMRHMRFDLSRLKDWAEENHGIRLEITIENPVSPATLGSSADTRELGIFVQHLEFS